MCLKKCLKYQAVTVNDVYLLRVVRMPGGVVDFISGKNGLTHAVCVSGLLSK